MCGIVGYTGERQAQPVLLKCLARLEYRGYDSCGIAVADDAIRVHKDIIRVATLARTAPTLKGTAGIGHSRWATCGEPSQINAHPHSDCSGNIAVVHNGVINNYEALKQQLIGEGHHFASETDTEVIPHLIEKYYHGSLTEAVAAALADVDGSYAIAVLMAGKAEVVAARKDSPLIIGIGDRENFIASDVPAVLDYTSRVIYLEDGDIATVSGDGVSITHDGAPVERKVNKVTWSLDEAQKGGYEHYMLKEIHEQPRVIRNTLARYLPEAGGTDLSLATYRKGEPILMLACGTSHHAALIAKGLIEAVLGVPVRAEMASEFNYYQQTLVGTLAIAITQSGETADVLKAIKRVKAAGCRVLAITNVVGSSASRVADQVIYTYAGPEISVAATKSFIAQLMVLYQMIAQYALTDSRDLERVFAGIRQLPSKVQSILDGEARIAECGKYLAQFDNALLIGRGLNFPVALEGALKLKEVAYLHAEGFAAGELKHGPFALLESRTPVIALATRDGTYEAMLTNVKEIKTRKAPVIALVDEEDTACAELADIVIPLPRVEPVFSPIINTVALQLLSYYAARERGCPIDFPRNLAKSVTVE
jgi:glutamine---fructose-6-phosphate transaminase (isomerizing)